MALPTNVVTGYSVIGNREDLANVIYNVSPTDTIFLSNAEKVSASASYHEWLVQDLAAAAANAQLEGDNAAAGAYNAATRVGNYCQISTKTATVSGSQEARDSAGNVGHMAQELVNRGLELKRDIEFGLVRNAASAAGNIGVARTSAGLESWLSSNYTSVGTGTAQTTPGFSSGTVAAPTDSTVLGTFTEASLKATLLSIYNNGGDPTMMMVAARNKQVASTFTGIATQYKENKNAPATIIGAAALYISDFGELSIVANRFMRNTTALILDMKYCAVAMLRNMVTQDLAITGDSRSKQIICEWTLEMRNQKASGKVTDIG